MGLAFEGADLILARVRVGVGVRVGVRVRVKTRTNLNSDYVRPLLRRSSVDAHRMWVDRPACQRFGVFGKGRYDVIVVIKKARCVA